MAYPMGESKQGWLRVDFDRRLKLEFHGSNVTTDAGFLAYRELDDALELTEMAGDVFCDSRTGKNGRHGMTGQFRQSLFGRLGGYEDVNDADRLGRDPAMRWIVGGHAIKNRAASTSQMGRFETELLASDENLAALTTLPGAWIDKVHDRRPPKMIVLDMDSSVRCVLRKQGYAISARNDHWKSFLSENQPNKGADRDLPRRFRAISCWDALCATIISNPSGPFGESRIRWFPASANVWMSLVPVSYFLLPKRYSCTSRYNSEAIWKFSCR